MPAPAPSAEGKGERTRRRLLEIAIRRFAAEGYRRTSVSVIAREAGVTPATTYAYFAGKEALFTAAIDADAAALIDYARGRMTGNSVRERWAPYLESLVNGLAEHPLAARVLGGNEPEVIHRLLDLPSLRAARNELESDLKRGQARGELRTDVDAGMLAHGLETFFLSLLMGWAQAGGGAGEDRVSGVMALLDAALRAPS